MNMNPNEKNVYYNSHKQKVFHQYEYEYVPRKTKFKEEYICFILQTFK